MGLGTEALTRASLVAGLRGCYLDVLFGSGCLGRYGGMDLD
jgi:hypothetical protein